MNRLALWLYMTGFFIVLLGPMLVLGITAFNVEAFPTVVPFTGFTWDWFAALAQDEAMIYGLTNSLWIGGFVVLLSVPLGLAGALVMQQIDGRARALYYLVVVSPVLTPGVIIGISTVVFWRDMTGLTGTRFLYNGTLLTVLGQASFISAYCMLVFLARLQRFDRTLEEAALDLGASRPQVFRHVLLPYLRPAILSAAVLAFLSSFENYNTTTFAILADKTLTTVLAGRVRQGVSPAVSALAVLIIAITLVGAVASEIIRRQKVARARQVARSAELLDAEMSTAAA